MAKKAEIPDGGAAGPGPGDNGGDISGDLLLYHVGRLERVAEKRLALNAEAKKIRTQASADGVQLDIYNKAKKLADLAPETNTENLKTLKNYLEVMGVPAGYQMTIDDVVAAQDTAKGTAYKDGRAAGIKGYSAKRNPYDDPASPECQSWLKGLADGGQRRSQIEAGEHEKEQEAA